jgi:phage-related protein (TIGR01555 family)
MIRRFFRAARRLLKRKPAAQPQKAAPLAALPPGMRGAPRISEAMLSALRAQTKGAAPAQASVFTLPQHPAGVLPTGNTGLAMDSAVGAVQSWANDFALSGYYSEGITFLGYAYLSELAQRPEYRVISETIATEMTRKWIRFTSNDGKDKADKITELENEFKRLNVRDMFCRAAEQDGFFGRGHIYIDTGDTDSPDELQKSIGDGWDKLSIAKLAKKPITALRTVEAVWCYPTNYNSNDPLKDNWYRPDSWYVQAKIVHTSRLITLIGREVPDLLKPTYSFGGLSLSQMVKPYVDNWLETRQSVNDIISAFTVFVLASNLQETLQADGDQLFKRAELFNLVRSNRGLMMIDKDTEDFKNVSASLSGLDMLQAQSQEHMASVSHIPLVKLLGTQPAGLNASSEGEIQVFYDYVHSFQEHLFRQPLHRLMGLVMISLWGQPDDGIDFEFEKLWVLDEKEAAEVEKTKAERDQILIDTGVLSPEESRKRVAADPDSDFSSIDVDDMPDLIDEEEEGLAPKGGTMIKDLGGSGEEKDDAA